MATHCYNSILYKFLNPNYAWHNDLPTRSNLTDLKNSFKMAQEANVEPDMATYWFNSMLCKFLNPNYAWHNDLTTRWNSTGLKNSFKTAPKTKVEPDMATYCYNSILYKFLNPNYAWHNDLPTRSNSISRIRPTSKTALKRHKKQMLSLIWLHIGSIVCCASF